MTKSIIQTGEPRCFYCGSRVSLERHHVLGGPNRKWSEKYGLWVYCCNLHHTDPKEGVQYNREMNQSLKRLAQIAFEKDHSRAEFMKLIGKNYL